MDTPHTSGEWEVVIVTPHRPTSIGLRALQATGALLTAVVLTSCGESPGGTDVPPAQNAQTPATSSSTGSAAESAAPGASATAGAPETESAQPKPPPSQSTRCHTSMLTGSLEAGEPGAGQRYAELVLRNTGSQTCTLYGYGGLQLVGGDGQRLPTDLVRTPNPGPELLRLAPGESASATLHWTAVPYGDEPIDGPCQPEPLKAQVIPPDETDPLTVSWQLGSVCQYGSIDGSAYHR